MGCISIVYNYDHRLHSSNEAARAEDAKSMHPSSQTPVQSVEHRRRVRTELGATWAPRNDDIRHAHVASLHRCSQNFDSSRPYSNLYTQLRAQ